MYTYEQKCVMNLGDAYTLLYGFIAGNLIGRLGKSGERAVREATRQFGYDRAETTRKRHLEVNAKINMLNLRKKNDCTHQTLRILFRWMYLLTEQPQW